MLLSLSLLPDYPHPGFSQMKDHLTHSMATHFAQPHPAPCPPSSSRRQPALQSCCATLQRRCVRIGPGRAEGGGKGRQRRVVWRSVLLRLKAHTPHTARRSPRFSCRCCAISRQTLRRLAPSTFSSRCRSEVGEGRDRSDMIAHLPCALQTDTLRRRLCR